MKNLKYLLLDLLSDQKIKLSHMLSDDFDMAFGVDSCGSISQDRKQAIQELFDENLIIKGDDDYLAFTQLGACEWEKVFCPNWELYAELFMICHTSNQETSYFYTCSLQIMQLFIDKCRGFLDSPKINLAENWQPIYWKDNFHGYYIKTDVDNEKLSKVFFELPTYKLNINLVRTTI